MTDMDALESAVDTLEGEFVDLENRVIALERKIIEQVRRLGELETRHATMANRVGAWVAERKIDDRIGTGIEGSLCSNCQADLAKMRPVQATLSMLPAGSLRNDGGIGSGEGDQT